MAAIFTTSWKVGKHAAEIRPWCASGTMGSGPGRAHPRRPSSLPSVQPIRASLRPCIHASTCPHIHTSTKPRPFGPELPPTHTQPVRARKKKKPNQNKVARARWSESIAQGRIAGSDTVIFVTIAEGRDRAQDRIAKGHHTSLSLSMCDGLCCSESHLFFFFFCFCSAPPLSNLTRPPSISCLCLSLALALSLFLWHLAPSLSLCHTHSFALSGRSQAPHWTKCSRLQRACCDPCSCNAKCVLQAEHCYPPTLPITSWSVLPSRLPPPSSSLLRPSTRV